jgi:hypothetical protein
MTTQQTIVSEIEKYIRDTVAKNTGSFNRDAILMQSKELMEKYPVEFNSILNMIENEERNGGSDFMDDSTPSVTYGARYGNDSSQSVTYGGCYAVDSISSVYHGSSYADDSTPSVYHGSGYADETPSIIHHQDDPMGSPIGSDVVDSSPNGNDDDDEIDSYMPLQRTMSSCPTRK